MNRNFHTLTVLTAVLAFTAATLTAPPATAKSWPDVDIQAAVHGGSVAFQAGTSRDLLSFNVRVVGPEHYLFEDRVELSGALEWVPDLNLAEGHYSWEAWAVTANPGAAMRNMPADTPADIAIEHFYTFADTQTHIASGIFMFEGGLLRPENQTQEIDGSAPLTRRVASAILNFLVPSAQARGDERAAEERGEGSGPPADSAGTSGVGEQDAGLRGGFTTDDFVSIFNPSGTGLTRLNLSGSAGNPTFWRLVNNADASDRFEIRAGFPGTPRMTFTQGGNVGIGTVTPSNALHIERSGGFQIRLTAGSTTHRLDSFGSGLGIGASGAPNQLRIQNNAPNNSLRIDDDGNIGLGTGSPVHSLHVNSGAGDGRIRLQTGGSTWDRWQGGVGLWIQRTAPTSATVMRLDNSAPTNSLVLQAAGAGFGTAAPAAPIHVQRANNSAEVRVTETGAGNSVLFRLVNNGAPKFRFENTSVADQRWEFGLAGTGGNERFVAFKVGSPATQMQIFHNGNMVISGQYFPSSSRAVKERIEELNTETVLARLEALPVHEWSYQRSPKNRHIGPMAEDFYTAFGLGMDDKHISPNDLAGVALAAAKALHDRNRELEAGNAELERRLQRVEALLAAE